ncbi:uncharacterized protein LOC132275789 [Cornus florida]|uniref:uncharacterized protein LOC132275789 n=1 Tax=Cornus florida TaxID=4283 RepID=UPI00289D218E|nr:uncharacterized protein LOC132275789 [Cornus florida]
MWNHIRRIIQFYDDEKDNESVLIFATLLEEQNFYQKRHCRDSILQGETYVMEILNGHRERCYENFRMYPEVFRTLRSTLKVYQLGTHIIAPPDFSVIPNKIREFSRFYPYFKNYVGAIDGTHIPATLPATGWEGSANDSRILKECIENEVMNFPAPLTGYANKPGYLALFRGHTYHFQEYRKTRQPRGREEVFNHRHSSLRNIIERCFGLLKMRFAILRVIPPYKFSTQVLIVMACCTLHNFIRNQHQPDDLFDGNDPPHSDGEDDEIVEHVPSAQLREMDQLCNTIADRIWNSLQHS